MASCQAHIIRKKAIVAFPKADAPKGFSIYGHEVRSDKAKVEKWI